MKCFLYMLLAGACMSVYLYADEKVPLKTDLPKPLFVGTPVPVKIPNLEPPRAGKRPEFLVPKGVTNVARDKPVTSSDNEPTVGDISQVTDGVKDGDEGNYVELGKGKQYVQIDLGKPHDIYAVLVWHYHSQARVYRDVVVQVSDDPDFIDKVTTIFNNVYDASTGMGVGVGKDPSYIDTYEGRLIDAKGIKGRYVRLYSRGNSANEANHYIEVEVWGKPGS
ncbi:hypothetical protein DB346_18245 [Verrucomicrobia bacterium LW23]|nr:hypothetical protein DB346_18245 [Verrucomicrobia bacterium LW23]